MTITRLDEEVFLPYNQEAILSDDKERLNEYVKELIGQLEQIHIKDIHERVNLLIDLQGGGGIIYLGTKDTTGDYPNGTWRINGSSTSEYLIQLKESGSWVTKGDIDSDSLATFANLILTGTTASRLLATNSSKQLVSSDLASWIAGTANEIDITDDGDGTITIGLVDPLAVNKGGTGVATLTDHGILLGSGTGAVTPLASATNGQLPIGSTGVDPVLAVLTAGALISIANGAGSITIAVIESNIDHGSIAGLTDDDHTQYLLVDGSREMTGDLSAPGYNIACFDGEAVVFDGEVVTI